MDTLYTNRNDVFMPTNRIHIETLMNKEDQSFSKQGAAMSALLRDHTPDVSNDLQRSGSVSKAPSHDRTIRDPKMN
jgi:hypothetical protein